MIEKSLDTKSKMQELAQFDESLFLFLNGLGNSQWDSFWLVLTNKWTSIPLYLVLAFFSYRNLGYKKFIVFLIAIGLMILVTDQLSNFFKYGVGRLRPCYHPDISNTMRLVKASCGGKFGFFSAHAANSVAVVSYFLLSLKTNKWLASLLLLWAILVSYSRIYIGVHYPLDVLVGMSVGFTFGWLFSRLYFKLNYKLHL